MKEWAEGASLRVESFYSIGSSVTIFLGGNHRVDWITTFPFGIEEVDYLGRVGIRGYPRTNGDVVIGDDVWIGYRVAIMSGITIGYGAVIAVNSVAVKNVDSH